MQEERQADGQTDGRIDRQYVHTNKHHEYICTYMQIFHTNLPPRVDTCKFFVPGPMHTERQTLSLTHTHTHTHTHHNTHSQERTSK